MMLRDHLLYYSYTQIYSTFDEGISLPANHSIVQTHRVLNGLMCLNELKTSLPIIREVRCCAAA